MEEPPLVSVIIPLFNHEQFIAQCLDSVLGSGYPRIEVIILDDGSTDASYETAERWRRRHAGAFEGVHLSRQANAGLPSTLNRLAGRASGEFVAPLASDDLLLPGGLEARIAALNAHDEWFAVFGDCMVIDTRGRRIADSGLKYIPERNRLLRANKTALARADLMSLELILRWSVPGSLLVVRRAAYDPFQGIGPYDETLATNDRDFYLRLLSRKALGFLNSVVAAYRIHSDNSISRPSCRPALARAISAAERKNAPRFAGVQRIALLLSALKSANYAGWLERPTLARLAAAVMFRAVFELACFCHDLRVAVVTRFHRRAA